MKFCGGRVDADDHRGWDDWMMPLVTVSEDTEDIELLKDSMRRSGLNFHEYVALYGGGYSIGDTDCTVGLLLTTVITSS